MRKPGAVDFRGMHSPDELLCLEVECENAVEARAREVQLALEDADLVAMLEVGIAERPQPPELLVVNEEFVARGDVNLVAVESDAAQASVPATPGPVDIRGIPVKHLVHGLIRRIDNVNAAVAFSLLTAAHYRRGDQGRDFGGRLNWIYGWTGSVRHGFLLAGEGRYGIGIDMTGQQA